MNGDGENKNKQTMEVVVMNGDGGKKQTKPNRGRCDERRWW